MAFNVLLDSHLAVAFPVVVVFDEVSVGVASRRLLERLWIRKEGAA
jgi:hypothetical protein